MAQKGVIRREHGWAVFGGSDDVGNRLAFHYEESVRSPEKLPDWYP